MEMKSTFGFDKLTAGGLEAKSGVLRARRTTDVKRDCVNFSIGKMICDYVAAVVHDRREKA